jgi:DNA repair ATPase RecN
VDPSIPAFDALSLFLPDEAVASRPDAPRATATRVDQSARSSPPPDALEAFASSPADLASLEEWPALHGQTETALERPKTDSAPLHVELAQLRQTVAQLAEEHGRLGRAVREAQARGQATSVVLNALGIGSLEAVRNLAASTDDRLASLSQLTQEMMRATADVEARRAAIDRSLVEATRIIELLAAFEARTTNLTESDWLRDAGDAVAQLERRAAEATVEVDSHVDKLEQRQPAIARALGEVTRATDLLTALDAQVARLTGPGQILDQAAESVEQLGRQAADVTVDVDRRVAGFEQRRPMIAQALVEVTRATETLSALDARVATLTGPGQLLDHAADTVKQLERQAADATVELDRRVSSFEQRRPAIAQALAEATRAGEVLSALDARVATLTAPGQALEHAAETVGQIERRAAEATVDLERRVTSFEQRRPAIEKALVEVTRTTEAVSALDARVAALTGPGLEHAEETVVHLERRAAEAVVDLERRADSLEGQRQTIAQALVEATRANEVLRALDARVTTLTGPGQGLARAVETVGQLERRIAEATVDLGKRVDKFETQKQEMAEALVGATRTTEVLRALDARVATLMGPGETVAHAVDTVGQLERRVAEATVDLGRRVDTYEAQKHTISQALAGVTRATGVLRALDARVATLTGPGQVLAHATETVGNLERRAAEAIAHLDRVARTKGELEQELADIQRQVRRLSESVGNGGHASAIGRQAARTLISRLPRTQTWSRALRAAWSWAQTPRPPAGRWTVAIGVLAALALLATVVMRSRDQPAKIGGSAPAASRASIVSARDSSVSGRPLPSRTIGGATARLPIARRGARVASTSVNDAASDRGQTKGAALAPPAAGVPASRAVPARPKPASTDAAVQPFSGLLAVESVPPGAAVYVDQRRVGETPLALTRLRAGSHVMWVEREGYERWTRSVLVTADEQTRVSARLQPLR